MHMGDLDDVPGSWVWSGPAPVVVAIWKVKQPMEDLFFSL